MFSYMKLIKTSHFACDINLAIVRYGVSEYPKGSIKANAGNPFCFASFSNTCVTSSLNEAANRLKYDLTWKLWFDLLKHEI